MKYNINVIKFVWRQVRKPSRVTLDAIISQNPQKTPRLSLRAGTSYMCIGNSSPVSALA